MVGVTLASDHHIITMSYQKACVPHDIPHKAVKGDCYVFTRGTYTDWDAPGVPPKGLVLT